MDGFENSGTMSLKGGILGCGYGMGAFDRPDSKRLLENVSPKGRKVIFTAQGGYDCELESAKKIIKIGAEYTVKEIYVGRNSSTVTLEEIDGKEFNTVMFIDKVEVV